MSEHKECFEGCEKDLGNSQGRCCCNCKFQATIGKHSLFGCIEPDHKAEDGSQVVSLSEGKHALCEMHDWR